MEIIIILVILLAFFIGIFTTKETLKSDGELECLIAEAVRGEAFLKRIDSLNKEWNSLIIKRSLALKESTLENYKNIDLEIEQVKLALNILLNN
jgi:hypothetical protein